jgi:hypothetical protein
MKKQERIGESDAGYCDQRNAVSLRLDDTSDPVLQVAFSVECEWKTQEIDKITALLGD